MLRTFNQHTVRPVSGLDGIWQMTAIAENGEAGRSTEVYVPSCWENIRGFESYRGVCKFTKKIETSAGHFRLVFYGVSHTADVFFDGQKVAHHYNAYTPFEVVLKNVTAGTHTVEVLADNRFSEASALHIPNDYRSYGGITRPVALECLSAAYVHHLHVTPLLENGTWKAHVKAQVTALEPCSGTTLSLKIANLNALSFNLNFENGVAVAETTVELPNCRPWSTEDPALYFATATLLGQDGTAMDDLTERFGLREVKAVGRKILLNGKQLFVKGFNRHEDYGNLGCAIPPEVMNADIDLIKSTGANLIRTCHYPNDQRFLDFCDERGILVWEEAHARSFTLENMQNPHFKQQSEDCINEMVENHYNHPSIIFWGILNECASDTEYGAECYLLQYKQLRSLDSTRLLTSASCKLYKDLTLGYADVVSINLYPKWYYKESGLELVEKVNNWIQTTEGADKPFLVSEFGAAGLYGFRSFSHDKYSEDRQAELLAELIPDMAKADYLSGLILWQFCDCRTDNEWGLWQGRPKTQNNKGIVDTYRRPKLSYEAVCKAYKELKK